MTTFRCPICNQDFQQHRSRKPRFCSRKCWGVFKTNRDAHLRPLEVASVEQGCNWCGKLYRPVPASVRHGMGRYCSRPCFWEARRTGASSTWDRQTRMSFYLQNGWPKQAESFKAGKVCSTCGTTEDLLVHHRVDPFPTRSIPLLLDPSNLLVLCKPCHTRHHHSTRVEVTCEVCKVVFTTPKRKPRKFCSITCRNKAWAVVDHTCEGCGKSYRPDRPEARFCSLTCGAAYTARVKHARRPEVTCSGCGKVFTVPPSRLLKHANPTCSRACAALVKTHGPRTVLSPSAFVPSSQ
jgi:hypothetical protein